MAIHCNPLLHQFILQLADNALVLGHRISEWCGHGPVLEQDIALANIALDHIGQARMYYQLAASFEDGATEDSYPYQRDVRGFRNLLLLEMENKDFGYTLTRSFFYDQFHYLLLEAIIQSDHKALKEIASQAIKEVRYHCRYSSDWMKRLGDGTEESHQRVQKAVDAFYMYTGEFFMPSAADEYMAAEFNINIESIKEKWLENIQAVLQESTLAMPQDTWFQKGGKTGVHTEKLGFLLAELQYIQRAYPNMNW